jgi:hypothetical protein
MAKVTKSPRKNSSRVRSFSPATEEMKRHAALIAAELEQWPGVTVRPFFGMWGAWRGKRIFAALPRTRSLGAENTMLFKFARLTPELAKRLQADERITDFSFSGKAQWHQFTFESERDLPGLLAWLAEAAGDDKR